jgi:hypothetical protein
MLKKARRLSCVAVKAVVAVSIEEISIPRNIIQSKNWEALTPLSVCFERGGKVAVTNDVVADKQALLKATPESEKFVKIPVNQKLELVTTLYREGTNPNGMHIYQEKLSQLILRRLVKNATYSGDSYKGLGRFSLPLHELHAEFEAKPGLIKELIIPLELFAGASLRLFIQSIPAQQYIVQLNTTAVDTNTEAGANELESATSDMFATSASFDTFDNFGSSAISTSKTPTSSPPPVSIGPRGPVPITRASSLNSSQGTKASSSLNTIIATSNSSSGSAGGKNYYTTNAPSILSSLGAGRPLLQRRASTGSSGNNGSSGGLGSKPAAPISYYGKGNASKSISVAADAAVVNKKLVLDKETSKEGEFTY